MILDRALSRLRRAASVGIARTLVYRTNERLAPHGDAAARRLQANELERLTTIGRFDVEDGRARLANGDACYAVSIDGELAHYAWVQTSGLHVIDSAAVPVAIEDGEFWIYNCRTAERHRGRGIYPMVLAQIVNDYLDAGAASAWIYTTEQNFASQRGILRAGFEQVGTLRALRMGRRYLRMN